MINQQTQLKLQAHLDKELSSHESQEVTVWLEHDPEARALYAELQGVHTLLKDGELAVKLPESREFFWSKIERSIRQETPQPQAKPAPRFVWLRIWAPAAGFALVFFAALALVKLGTSPTAMSYLHEIETPLEDTSAISFHSQSPAMTVVWVQSQAN